MRKRIVITGAGIVSPVGIGVRQSWENVLAGKSGIGHITKFDTSDFPIKIAGELKGFNAEDFLDKKDARRYDDFIVYAVAATELAMRESGLLDYPYDGERAGVVVGSGIGGFKTITEMQDIYRQSGYRRVSPFFIPTGIINMASGAVSMRYKFLGPNISIVTACTSGTHAIGEGAKYIERGDADIVIAGGTEAPILPVAVAGFANMKALSRRNDDPEKASRPFDLERDGFVVSEGAAIVILESYEHAERRGADILAEISGYGLTGDAYHMTAPDETAQGARRCMAMAVRDAGIDLSDIGYINAHGTSTEYNDVLETKAIKDLFGEQAYKINISSTKSMTGHMLGAAGCIEAIFSALALKEGIIPPTINLVTPDPLCDLNYTVNNAVKADIKYALSNSFGFGGTNGTLVLKKYDPNER